MAISYGNETKLKTWTSIATQETNTDSESSPRQAGTDGLLSNELTHQEISIPTHNDPKKLIEEKSKANNMRKKE